MMYGNLDDSRGNQNNNNNEHNIILGGSTRSLVSESESVLSEVGSLLSGLSQARKIPDRRKLPSSANRSGSHGKGLRSKPPSSIAVKATTTNNNSNGNGFKSARSTQRKERPARSAAKEKKKSYEKDVHKIIKIQAFGRGYISRFAYQSRLTMERTKQRFFAIQIQSQVRGFLQRQRFRKTTGKNVVKHKRVDNPKKTATGMPSKRVSTGLGSPMPTRRARQVREVRNKKPILTARTDNMIESDSERSEISIRMERLTSNRMDRLTRPLPSDERSLADSQSVSSIMSNLSQARKIPDRRKKLEEKELSLGDSQSEVGSIMSNLSVARKVPDRRKKREEKETNAVKIQAIARGYIQRFLYRSILAMENTKKKYFAITIQAHVRGHLQRVKGPRIAQKFTIPLRERMAVQSNSKATQNALPVKKKETKKKKERKDASGRHSKDVSRLNNLETPNTHHERNRKPRRHRSDSDPEDRPSFPKELTIRKPRRPRHSDSEESGVPVKQLTIRKPTRRQSDSEESSNILPHRHVPRRQGKTGRNGERHRHSGELSPPRKIMLQVKKPRNKNGGMDNSEPSVDRDKPTSRRERLMSLGGASERFGESESDVGSLMSGLSQARKVPDRRRLPGLDATRGKTGRRDSPKTKSAIIIQSLARGYIQRFAYRSKLIMEQSKNKFFAIQIQAIARGYLTRKKLSR